MGTIAMAQASSFAFALERTTPAIYLGRMDRQSIIAILREHQAELHRQGVLHAALFGSVARGDAAPGSDIDIMIDLDPDARLGAFDYVGLKDYIAGLFDSPVDVVNREGLKPYVKPAALSDAVYAF